MKRYVIVYADGSSRRLTQIDYLSYEAAEDALMYYDVYVTKNMKFKS